MAAYRKTVAYRNSSTYPGGDGAPVTPTTAGKSTTEVRRNGSATGITFQRSTTSVSVQSSTIGRG